VTQASIPGLRVCVRDLRSGRRGGGLICTQQLELEMGLRDLQSVVSGGVEGVVEGSDQPTGRDCTLVMLIHWLLLMHWLLPVRYLGIRAQRRRFKLLVIHTMDEKGGL
jgi:hypothetical protein